MKAEWLAVAFVAACLLLLAIGIADRVWGYPLVAACDVSGDGVIDSADLGLQARAFGTSGTADVNLDGTVNSADLGLCARHFGERAFADDGSWVQNDATIAAVVTQDAIATETATP